MTALTQLHIERTRHADDHRLAGRSCASIGAMGIGAPWSVDAAGGTRWTRMSQWSDRKQPWANVTFSRTNGFGYRSLDAGHRGAGFGFRGDAP